MVCRGWVYICIFVFFGYFLRATDQQEHGTDICPADPPKEAGLGAQHLLYIGAEAVYSIEPKDTGGLDEDHKKNGQTGSIDIQEVDQHHAALKGKEYIFYLTYIFYFTNFLARKPNKNAASLNYLFVFLNIFHKKTFLRVL